MGNPCKILHQELREGGHISILTTRLFLNRPFDFDTMH